MSNFMITSEIHENSVNSIHEQENTNNITTFTFEYPNYMKRTDNDVKYDKDGDLIVNREKYCQLFIEHSISTELQLVGLQVWRGALLLADYILNNPVIFKNQNIIELGSGVGLTSIIAGIFANQVICTDIKDILSLIKRNYERNCKYINAEFHVMELDFLNENWSPILKDKLTKISIFLAADVIYDDEITEGFVNTLDKLLNINHNSIAYIALEKRFVFTLADLESVAPMYEEFHRLIIKKDLKWNIQLLNINFTKYFQYERVNQMILMKIQHK